MRKSIMLLITYKCNLRCSYCYEPKIEGFSMSAARAKEIITEQLELLDDNVDSVEIQFMGGEPLLEFPLIQNVAEWIWNQNISNRKIMLFAPTNGTLLTDEMKRWFSANKDKITLGLSFDGDVTMQNINRSNSYSKVDLNFFARTWSEQSVKMTISPETVHKLYDGVVSLHKEGFVSIAADLAMGPNVAWTKEALLVYRDELNKLIAFYLENPHLIPFSMLRVNVTSIVKEPTKSVKTCACGEDMICVDWTGHSYACHLFSPVALPLEKARRSNELYDFSNHEEFVIDKCSECLLNTICNHCYGMNYLCTGDVKKTSPFHCSAFRLMFVANCRFMMQKAEMNKDEALIESINNVLKQIK